MDLLMQIIIPMSCLNLLFGLLGLQLVLKFDVFDLHGHFHVPLADRMISSMQGTEGAGVSPNCPLE